MPEKKVSPEEKEVTGEISDKNPDTTGTSDTCILPAKNVNPDVPLAGFVSVIHRMHGIYLNSVIASGDLIPGVPSSNGPDNPNKMPPYKTEPVLKTIRELTPGQFPFLMILSAEPDCTQDRLADILLMDKGTVARAVRKMEDNGLVIRKPDPRNRRKYNVYLTEKGEAVVPEIHAIDRRWEEELFCVFSGEEKEQIMSAFSTLAKISYTCAKSVGKDKST